MAKRLYNLLVQSRPHIFFILLACSIIPTTRGGFMFLLDDAFQYPDIFINYQTIGSQTFAPFLLLLKGLNFWVPGWFLQRILYIGCLYGLGIVGYNLATYYIDSRKKWIAVIMGIFLVCNPFVYNRLIYGQLGVLISMMCIVGLLYALLKYRDYRDNTYIIHSGLWGGISIMRNVQSLFFVGLICLSFILVFWGTFKRHIENSLKHLTIFCIIILGLNSVRLVSNFIGDGTLREKAASIANEDYLLFSTHGDESIWTNQLLMNGFWKEKYKSHVSPYKQDKQAVMIAILMGLTALFGISYSIYKNVQNRLTILWILLAGSLGFILSMGIAGPSWIRTINQFLINTIPFYDSVREPHKRLQLFVILFGLSYTLGIYVMVEFFYINKYIKTYIIVLFGILPCLYVPQLFANGHTFMHISEYPDNWYKLKYTLLEQYRADPEKKCDNESCYDVLVLPRHLYMSTSFSQKIINNPAEGFFSPIRILQGDNIEIGSIYSQSTRKESKIVEEYFSPIALSSINQRSIAFIQNFGSIMNSIGIDYLLVLKESNWHSIQQPLDLLAKNNQISILTDDTSYILYSVGEK